MENDNPKNNHGLGFLLILLLVFCVIVIFPFFTLPKNKDIDKNFMGTQTPISRAEYSQRPLSIIKNIGLKELMKIGKQNLEHNKLLSKIREDLKVPKEEEISIFIGPYQGLSGEGRIVGSSNPFGFIILLDEIFYSDLTPEEKTAVIAHELGHLTNENLLMMYNPDTPILFQIEADTYATKYARPEAVIGFLNKVLKQKGYQSSEVPSREYQFRIKNLEKIKQYRQAH